MPPASPALASIRPAASPTLQSLEAQVALLPQALGLFAICLPIYVWVGSYAANAKYMAATFAIFALNWAAFYVVVNWLRRDQARDEGRRLRVQLFGGLLWAGAVKLAHSKSDLIATLSHEIRNGLTGVAHVLAAAAGQNGRAAPSREQLAAALAAANDLIAVLNATLDSETAEAGRLKVEAAPFDPVRLIRELAVLTRPQAVAKELEFHVYVEPELDMRRTGAAVADMARVRQVLANLMGNAVKYTLRGRIEARVERRGEDRLAIAIAATRPGLSPEEMVVAFEPFKRVARTGAGVPGAGLGLSLSRQLVSLMGGELTAGSAVRVGSCFTLILPYDPTALIVSREIGDH